MSIWLTQHSILQNRPFLFVLVSSNTILSSKQINIYSIKFTKNCLDILCQYICQFKFFRLVNSLLNLCFGFLHIFKLKFYLWTFYACRLAIVFSSCTKCGLLLRRYQRKREKLVERTAISRLPTKWGLFQAYCYRSKLDGTEHIAVVKVKLLLVKQGSVVFY